MIAKRDVMGRYRFAVCFENTIFPGYLTENLDCLLSGCIPIYWGDPTVESQVPPSCYIDFRKFGSLPELDRFLHQFGANEARNLSCCNCGFPGVGKLHPLFSRHLPLNCSMPL